MAQELQLRSHPKVLEHQLAYPTLNLQLAEIDPAKEILQLGLRGGGGGGNAKNCYPQGQESHATEQQTQHRHMVEQHMH